jgi:hypothetical protein
LSFQIGYSQGTHTFNDKLDFLIHLSSNQLHEESKIQFNSIETSIKSDLNKLDSLNYLMGFLYYRSDSLIQARTYLNRVSENNLLFYKSRMYHSYISLKIDQPDTSIQQLLKLQPQDNFNLDQIIKFQLAGSYLLKGDVNKCDSISNLFQSKDSVLMSEQINLINYSTSFKNNRRKSPFVAGTLSAIIPGMGKVYAGNTAQGLSSFLRVGILGAITAENYFRLGIKHPQTILFASLFSAFYIGNIWGSALSVQIVKTEKDLENKANILVGIRVPLSYYFN